MTFDAVTMTLSVITSNIKETDIGNHAVQITIIDYNGLKSTYSLTIKVDKQFTFVPVVNEAIENNTRIVGKKKVLK